ncbi:hypothetical protein QJQ45_027517 [Haematococcus lacustris]|nr:hypothetical protein QJQ45_027517 [Haematococcus lacustris]
MNSANTSALSTTTILHSDLTSSTSSSLDIRIGEGGGRSRAQGGSGSWLLVKQVPPELHRQPRDCVTSAPLEGQHGLSTLTAALAVLQAAGQEGQQAVGGQRPQEVEEGGWWGGQGPGLHVQVWPSPLDLGCHSPWQLNSLGSSGWSAVHLAALTSLWRCLQPALDLLVPQGRRGSACPQALPLPERDAGGAPGRVSGLVSSCNPAGRNYKLDLHALYISKAVQFKQAAASTNIDEVCGWVHLCCRLVDKAQQAAHLAPLQPAPPSPNQLLAQSYALAAGHWLWAALAAHQLATASTRRQLGAARAGGKLSRWHKLCRRRPGRSQVAAGASESRQLGGGVRGRRVGWVVRRAVGRRSGSKLQRNAGHPEQQGPEGRVWGAGRHFVRHEVRGGMPTVPPATTLEVTPQVTPEVTPEVTLKVTPGTGEPAGVRAGVSAKAMPKALARLGVAAYGLYASAWQLLRLCSLIGTDTEGLQLVEPEGGWEPGMLTSSAAPAPAPAPAPNPGAAPGPAAGHAPAPNPGASASPAAGPAAAPAPNPGAAPGPAAGHAPAPNPGASASPAAGPAAAPAPNPGAAPGPAAAPAPAPALAPAPAAASLPVLSPTPASTHDPTPSLRASAHPASGAQTTSAAASRPREAAGEACGGSGSSLYLVHQRLLQAWVCVQLEETVGAVTTAAAEEPALGSSAAQAAVSCLMQLERAVQGVGRRVKGQAWQGAYLRKFTRPQGPATQYAVDAHTVPEAVSTGPAPGQPQPQPLALAQDLASVRGHQLQPVASTTEPEHPGTSPQLNLPPASTQPLPLMPQRTHSPGPAPEPKEGRGWVARAGSDPVQQTQPADAAQTPTPATQASAALPCPATAHQPNAIQGPSASSNPQAGSQAGLLQLWPPAVPSSATLASSVHVGLQLMLGVCWSAAVQLQLQFQHFQQQQQQQRRRRSRQLGGQLQKQRQQWVGGTGEASGQPVATGATGAPGMAGSFALQRWPSLWKPVLWRTMTRCRVQGRGRPAVRVSKPPSNPTFSRNEYTSRLLLALESSHKILRIPHQPGQLRGCVSPDAPPALRKSLLESSSPPPKVISRDRKRGPSRGGRSSRAHQSPSSVNSRVEVVCRPRGPGDQLRGRVVLVDEHRTSRVSSAVNGQQPCEVELDKLSATRPAGWKPPAGQVEQRLVRPAWSQERDQPVRGLMWCPVVAPRKPPQAPRSSQAATQPAASEPGPSTPPPAKRSKQAAEPTQPTKGKGKAARGKPAPQPGRWLDRDCNAALNMQRIGESRWRPLELCYWPEQGALPAKGKEYPGLGYKRVRDKPPKAQEQQQQPAEAHICDGLTMLFSMAKKKRRTVPRPVPEDPDSDIEDRDEALQPDLTEAQQNRKVSGEARAARDRDNTYHGRKCKIAHLIDHLPQELWDAFLADAVRPRLEAISERGVLASLLLGLLVRGLFTIRVADPLGLHDQPVYTDIPVSQAAIPDLSCRNLYLQLCRGPPGNGANTQPNAAVAAVLAEHPDLRARLAAIPRHLSDANMVDHVGKQLETAFSNMLTLLFAGRLKKSVSLAGAKVLLGTEEPRRRFGFWGVGGGHLPAWSKRECTYVRRMVCGLDVSWLLEQGGVVPTPAMQAEVALQRGLLGLEEGERVDDDWVEDPVNRGRLLRHAVHTAREMEAAMAAWQLDMVPWQQAELTNPGLLPRPPRPPTPYALTPTSKCQARHIFIDTRGLYGMMHDAGMLGVLTEAGVTSLKKFRNGALPDPAVPGNFIAGPKDSHVANRWDALLPDPRRQKLASPKHNFAQIVHTDGVAISVMFLRPKPAAPPAELPRMGRGLDAVNPLAHLHAEWLGVDPGKTNMATVAHEERSAAGTVVSVRHWKLTAGQYYRDSGITRQAQATKTWLTKVKPQLTALSRVSSKPSSLASYRRFADTVLETYDAMWAEVSKKRWANAKFRLYCGKMRVVASFWAKVKKQAQKLWPDRILALAYGAASFSGSGSIGCRGVPVSQMRKEAVQQFGAGRVVLVDEFRTSRVSSAYSHPIEALPGQPPESFRWLRPVYSEAKRSQVRGLMSSTSYNIRFYDRDVSAALNIRRCAVGPGPRPTELCYWDGRPAMPKPGRPGQEWVYLRDKALLLDKAKPGSYLTLTNAKVEMYRGTMRLAVDKWGSLETAEGASFQPKVDNNMSLIEFELVPFDTI